MGLYRTINDLKVVAANTKMVNMVSFGDIQEYNNKATIRYPYINLDIVTAQVQNWAKGYKIRIYVCDRNEPYVAYNKAELILDSFLKNNEVSVDSYIINYFSYDYKDNIHGVWADITIESTIESECDVYSLPDTDDFILQENGDLIRIEIIPA